MDRNKEVKVAPDQGKDSADSLNRRANANGVALKNTQLQMENVQPWSQPVDSATSLDITNLPAFPREQHKREQQAQEGEEDEDDTTAEVLLEDQETILEEDLLWAPIP